MKRIVPRRPTCRAVPGPATRTALRTLAAAVLCCIAVVGSALGLEVVPQDRQVLCGPTCNLQVPVIVSGTASLDAVGFDLLFDESALEYLAVRRGSFVRNWAEFGAQLLPGARVRVGGFDAGAFALAGAETLAVLTFRTRLATGCTTYRTDALVDDLAPAPARTGFAAWSGWSYPANGYVAVYPDGQAPSCCFDTPNGTVLAVVAHTAGASAAGIAGAEFRIEISPPAPGATLTWTPDAAVGSSLGDPIDNPLAGTDSAGVQITFASCRLPAEATSPLGTITVSGLTGAHDLLVKRHRRPATSPLPCAQWTLCDVTSCSVACMARTLSANEDPVVFRARVNDAGCDPASCGFVPVAPRSWTAVKQIYR